jgi:hypothetical protein
VIEDSGYLPHLAMLIDRGFKFILASVVRWAGDLIGSLDILSRAHRPIVEFARIPASSPAIYIRLTEGEHLIAR